jgi:cytoskeletal protein RodZ
LAIVIAIIVALVLVGGAVGVYLVTAGDDSTDEAGPDPTTASPTSSQPTPSEPSEPTSEPPTASTPTEPSTPSSSTVAPSTTPGTPGATTMPPSVQQEYVATAQKFIEAAASGNCTEALELTSQYFRDSYAKKSDYCEGPITKKWQRLNFDKGKFEAYGADSGTLWFGYEAYVGVSNYDGGSPEVDYFGI